MSPSASPLVPAASRALVSVVERLVVVMSWSTTSAAMALPMPTKPIRQPIIQCLARMAGHPLTHRRDSRSSQKPGRRRQCHCLGALRPVKIVGCP